MNRRRTLTAGAVALAIVLALAAGYRYYQEEAEYMLGQRLPHTPEAPQWSYNAQVPHREAVRILDKHFTSRGWRRLREGSGWYAEESNGAIPAYVWAGSGKLMRSEAWDVRDEPGWTHITATGTGAEQVLAGIPLHMELVDHIPGD